MAGSTRRVPRRGGLPRRLIIRPSLTPPDYLWVSDCPYIKFGFKAVWFCLLCKCVSATSAGAVSPGRCAVQPSVPPEGRDLGGRRSAKSGPKASAIQILFRDGSSQNLVEMLDVRETEPPTRVANGDGSAVVLTCFYPTCPSKAFSKTTSRAGCEHKPRLDRTVWNR